MKKVLLAILITLFWVGYAYSGPWDGWSSAGVETALGSAPDAEGGLLSVAGLGRAYEIGRNF